MRTDPCVDCVKQLGLCQHHAPAILPQRAIPPWVWLIGETHVEQRGAQLDAAEAVAVERARRREERKRSRRGLAGLLTHIATA